MENRLSRLRKPRASWIIALIVELKASLFELLAWKAMDRRMFAL